MTDQKTFWNSRYERDDYLFGERPNDFVRATVPVARAGQRAYAPADGEGRNGVFLAEQGYSVVSVDVADVAVDKSRRLAAKRGVSVDARVGSLFDFADRGFDVIAVSFMHFRPEARAQFHEKLTDALGPGGLLVFEGYAVEQLLNGYSSGGPQVEDMLLTEQILRDEFSALDILLLQSVERTLSEGPRHRGRAATVQLVARKPANS